MSNQENTCPICGEGQLHERVEQEMTEYKGHAGHTPLYFSICDGCGSEQTNASQSRANKRAMIAFKKEIDGLLTGAQVREAREKDLKGRPGKGHKGKYELICTRCFTEYWINDIDKCTHCGNTNLLTQQVSLVSINLGFC